MTRLPITPADCAPTIITWRECIYYSHRARLLRRGVPLQDASRRAIILLTYLDRRAFRRGGPFTWRAEELRNGHTLT